jgi:hypothetical protein
LPESGCRAISISETPTLDLSSEAIRAIEPGADTGTNEAVGT